MHYCLLLITPDTDSDINDVVETAMAPFYEAEEEWDPRTEPYEENGETYWHNPNAKWDWYQIGGRWSDLLEATKGLHGERNWVNEDVPHEPGHYDSALVEDIANLDELRTYSVLTPDGEWYDRETYDDSLITHEHPYGMFVEEPMFLGHFKECFIDPYPGHRFTIVDYHR